jgi:simple sugar transport system permease protein
MTTITPTKPPAETRTSGVIKSWLTRLTGVTGLHKLDGTGWQRLALVTGAFLASLVVFAILAAIQGANPFTVFHSMLGSALFDSGAFEQTLLRAIPICLAALAVAIPARAGLVNVGGEGQLIVGAIAATGIGVQLGAVVPGVVSWVTMIAGGAAAGAIWAGIAGILRIRLGINEAVTTLLLNFVANDTLLYLTYQPWKDPNGLGQPQSKPLDVRAQLPLIFGSQLNIGIVITAVTVLVVWFAVKRTGWGFAIRVTGGNQDAARRAGLKVRSLMLSAMLAGGALAGIGGALNLAGVETMLRPDITVTFGYVAFLASFLARHDPLKTTLAALLFSAIALSGNGLQISTGLDGTITDILLGLIVLAPLALTKKA